MIVGKGAKDISKATGGWSFTWQGTGNTNSNFPGATSIFEGLESLIRKTKELSSILKMVPFPRNLI